MEPEKTIPNDCFAERQKHKAMFTSLDCWNAYVLVKLALFSLYLLVHGDVEIKNIQSVGFHLKT